MKKTLTNYLSKLFLGVATSTLVLSVFISKFIESSIAAESLPSASNSQKGLKNNVKLSARAPDQVFSAFQGFSVSLVAGFCALKILPATHFNAFKFNTKSAKYLNNL